MPPRIPSRSVLICLILLLTATFGFGSLFINGTSFPVGQGPGALASGDFNHDGFTDLAVLNMTGNAVSVLLGTGSGAFQPDVKYKTGTNNTESLAIGDFNGDGNPDIAVNAYSEIDILFGNGDGTFQPFVLGITAYVYSFAVGDFNNDGFPDLVYTSYNGFSELVVQLGNGDGSFQPPQTVSSNFNNFGAITVGDFNHDGNADVAVTSDENMGYDGSVKVFLGFGTGAFRFPDRYSVGRFPSAIVAADFNGDGNPDLAVVDNSSQSSFQGALCILLNKGDGSFQLFRLYQSIADIDSVAIATGDFNKDGIADLAVANAEPNDVNEFIGNGDGTFRKVATWSVGSYPLALLALDLNGDGVADLVSADAAANEVRVLLGQSGGAFNGARNYSLPNPSYLGAAGDFNEDGKTDIVAGSSYALDILLGQGRGKFQPTTSYTTPGLVNDVVAIDLNGDGHLDLVNVNRNPYGNSSVDVRLGNGDGTFQNTTKYVTAVESQAAVVVDFNEDGILDMVVSNYGDYNAVDGNFNLFFGNGDGTFRSGGAFAIPGFSPERMVAGDFNGDGHQDLAIITLGAMAIVLGNGDGTFQPATVTSGRYNPGFILAADFNSDGKPDLVISNGYPAVINVLLGNGDGTFQTTDYNLVPYPGSMVIGDFNGDGFLDVAVVVDVNSSFPGEVYILRGKGDGTFTVTSEGTVGFSPQALVGGDFNQDGRLDAVLFDGNAAGLIGELTVLLNTAH